MRFNINLLAEIQPIQQFLEQVYQPVLVINQDNKIVYANPASLQLFNTTSIDLQNKSLSEHMVVNAQANDIEKKGYIVRDDNSKQMVNIVESGIEYEGKKFRFLLIKPIETQALNQEDKVKLLLKTIHKDISRREEEIEKLANEIEARSKLLNAAAIVSETDKFGTITFVNDTFCKLAQYSREELIGKPHNIVRHPDTPKAVFKEMWETIKKGEVFQGVIKNRAKDGTPYWVIATVGGVLDTEGKPYKYIGVRIDITPLMEKGIQVNI
jgi:PAS domain S-box-containing protein